MTLPLVFVSGPISSDPLRHTRVALRLNSELIRSGKVLPFTPHLSCFTELVAPLTYEDWMAYDFGVIGHCQAVFRMPGISPGADREVAYAASLNLPVFRHLPELLVWADEYASFPVAT